MMGLPVGLEELTLLTVKTLPVKGSSRNGSRLGPAARVYNNNGRGGEIPSTIGCPERQIADCLK
jgi:hypothetical protein